MEHRTDHPLDIDLLECAVGPAADPQPARVSDHLSACLLCRIRLARIRRADIQPATAPAEVVHSEVSQRVLAVLTAERAPDSVAPGQVWLTGGARRMPLWVRAVLDNAVTVYAVTLDVEAADDTELIVDEFEAIGCPVAIMASVVGTVPKERLAIYLGDLDVRRELEHIAGASSSGLTAGFTTGVPITSRTDERIEFRQFLADELAAMDSIKDGD